MLPYRSGVARCGRKQEKSELICKLGKPQRVRHRGVSSCRLQVWLYLGPLWSSLIGVFPGCGELFSGRCRSPPSAKIMSNTKAQEFEIYWLGTEMGLLKIEMKVRCDCQITMEMTFNSSTSHKRFLPTSIWHSSIFLKDNQNKIGSLLCSKVSSHGF